jgi:hypothetical protein
MSCAFRCERRGSILQSVVLVVLVAVVAAVTGLNHWTTEQSTNYFTEVSAIEAREMERAIATGDAQVMANHALYIARMEADRGVKFERERDEARQFALGLYQQNIFLNELLDRQEARIRELTAALEGIGADIPPCEDRNPCEAPGPQLDLFNGPTPAEPEATSEANSRTSVFSAGSPS